MFKNIYFYMIISNFFNQQNKMECEIVIGTIKGLSTYFQKK